MLAALIKSAYSSNIKERQDCSTVIIDANGRLAVPSGMSIPIHLSSFELTGAAIFERFPKESLRPGTSLPSTTRTAEAPLTSPTSPLRAGVRRR